MSDMRWTVPSGTETFLGAHIADAMLNYAITQDPSTIIGITNDGGIRKAWDPEDGYILFRHVFDTLPFSNSAMLLTMTGQNLHAVLEQQWAADRAAPRMLQISGMRYDFDETLPMGGRVLASTMEFFDPASSLWVPVDMDTKYRIVTNDFLAYGGSTFSEFLKAEDQLPLEMADNEYTAEYNRQVARENDGWIVPPTFERAINATADRSGDLTLLSHVEYLPNNEITVIFRITTVAEITGPFRATLHHDGLGETITEVLEQESITPTTPIELAFSLPYGPWNQPTLQFGLYDEVFDNSPLPRGLERRLTLEPKDGLPDSSTSTESSSGPTSIAAVFVALSIITMMI
eukprot:Protomagalhaensia_wolfi_Nauph_80__2017@NODE_227_length_3123_cov_696_261673_g169_i0_p1_GENE_NODE_227_length_3123_cov_696_261673_g169_i0NODE_227_length_3123_cov_696_261673_g169_i0_p1_ORF_typecomplete_len375_score82_135_nucleotid_C/PF02872_18/9_8e31_NODE_227_length_3123_cov_696_261673_g169_i019983035